MKYFHSGDPGLSSFRLVEWQVILNLDILVAKGEKASMQMLRSLF